MAEDTRTQLESLAGHPVLGFLNTRPFVAGQLEDQLNTDSDVLSALGSLGWDMQFKGTGLLAQARNLREELRRLVESRKAGRPLDPEKLNEFLREARSHLHLGRSRGDLLAVEKVWQCDTPRQALAPVAEAAADLLVNGDFQRIRQCESEPCVLWFYDRTKSHRRRWCSMASCGNRSKVAAFRERHNES